MVIYDNGNIVIRTMNEAGIDFFAEKFLELNWGNRKETLTSYFTEQKNHVRDVLVAVHHGTPVGYISSKSFKLVGTRPSGEKIPRTKSQT